MISIAERLNNNNSPILYDGAKGTLLAPYVSKPGELTDLLNLTKPEIVRKIHQRYIDAGSQLIETNTFCSNAVYLGNKSYAVSRSGAEIARSVAEDNIYVAGDVGPTGKFLKPLGSMSADECKQAFLPQIKGLIDGRVDLIHLETMYDPKELLLAIKTIREINPEIPIMATMSFNKTSPMGMRTMMGTKPEELVAIADQNNLLAYGANCGKGLLGIESLVKELLDGHPNAIIVTKMNAGLPRMEKMQEVYPGTPKEMAEHALKMYDLGVRIIGACCGSSPQHIEAMANTLYKRT